MPSIVSWQPAPTTAPVAAAVGLPERVVVRLLRALHADGRAVEAGGRWRRRKDLPPER